MQAHAPHVVHVGAALAQQQRTPGRVVPTPAGRTLVRVAGGRQGLGLRLCSACEHVRVCEWWVGGQVGEPLSPCPEHQPQRYAAAAAPVPPPPPLAMKLSSS